MSDFIETLYFGKRRVDVHSEAYYDLIFYQPREWCRFLMEHDGWRYLDEACQWFHPDHVEMLAHWTTKEAGQLPEEIRKPVDGTVRDLNTLMVYLAAALRHKVARHRLEKALDAYFDGPPTLATEEAVRDRIKDLIDATLEYPPPYRDHQVQGALVWTDFVDRAWLQGLNVPTPWGTRRMQGKG